MNRIKLKCILSATILILMSCTLEEPTLPAWLANWRIPFESSYTMEEVIEEPNFMADTTTSGQAIVSFSLSDSTEERSVSSSDLAMQPDENQASAKLEGLTLGTLGPENSNTVPIESILGFPLQQDVSITVPSSTIEVDLLYLLYVDVGWAEIKDGTFHLEFINNTFLSIQSGMLIDIYDDSTDVLLGTATFPDPIGPLSYGVASPDMDLSEQLIHKRFLLKVQMPIDAVNNRLITAEDLDDAVWVTGTLIDLNLHSAEAIFPPQYIDINDSSSVIEEEHRIRTAVIDHGIVDMVIHNYIDATASIEIKLLNFYDPSGAIVSDSLIIGAKEVMNKTIELNNYLIADYPDKESGQLIDYLRYEVHVITDSTGDYALLSEDDSVSVVVTPDSLFFSAIDGLLNNVEIEIDPVEKNDLEELSKIDGTIYLDSLEMTIDVINGMNIPITLTLNISGDDGSEQINLAPIQMVAQASDVTQIKLSTSDPHPNIVDLMAILPRTIRMEAEAIVEGNGTVEVGQTVRAEYNIYSPLFLRIAEKSYLESDITEENLNEDVRDKIANNLQNAFVYLDIVNGLPVGSSVAIHVATDSTNLYDDQIADPLKKFIIPDLSVQAANVDADGYVDEALSNKIPVELTQAQLDLFGKNEKVYIGTKIELNQTSGLVKFRLKDKITTYGQFRFDFLMNKEKE